MSIIRMSRILGIINLTSLNDCKVIINDSDYETTVKITELKVIKSINIRVVTIVAIASIIIGFITFTSLNDY